jgi:cytochrome c
MRAANVIACLAVVAGGLCATVAIPGVSPAPSGAPAGDNTFVVCRACHTLHASERNGIGPNLHGLFGRRAGGAAGYAYSSALKSSGLVWNDQTLSEFLANPAKRVPGTRMPVSVADPAKRAALIAYLRTETAK